MEKPLKKFRLAAAGLLAGVVNGMLGTGGGIAAVSLLERSGLEKRQCHATSIGIILPLSFFSALIYYKNGHFTLPQLVPFLPSGLAGALAGSFLLKNISKRWLRLLFGIFSVYSSVRLFMR